MKKSKINNIAQLEEILKRESKGPASLADAVRKLPHYTYNISKNAKEFAHKFKIMYKTIFQPSDNRLEDSHD